MHTLDHFLWGEGAEHEIVDAGVIHHVDNESDHSPIYCNVEILDDYRSIPKQATSANPRPSWQRRRQVLKRRLHLYFHPQKSWGISGKKNIYHYQIKKCKKAELEIKKQKLLSAMLEPHIVTLIYLKKLEK